MSRKDVKEDRNTWIVLQLMNAKPAGIMTDPRKWANDSIHSATFTWECSLNGKEIEEQMAVILRSDKNHKMPKQTAESFAHALNSIRSSNDVRRRIAFKAVSLKIVKERKKKPKPPQPKPLEVYYQKCDDAMGPYRWWQNNHFSDQFDVIDEKELKIRIAAAKMLGVPIHDHLPED